MSVVKDVVGGLAPIIGIGALIGGIWLFRDQIKSWFTDTVTEPITQLPGQTADAVQTVVDQQATSITDLNPDTGGWLVSSVESAALWLSEQLGIGDQSATEVSPVTGNPIVYQPSQVSEHVATNAYLPGVTLVPENQDTLWRPSAEKIGQIFDKSEFRPGETDVYEIWRLTGTGTTQILATGVGVGPSQGGIDPSAWDTVFKAGTYEVIWS